MRKKEEIILLVDGLKKEHGRKIISNCYNYGVFDDDDSVRSIHSSDSIIVTVDESDVRRLYFFVSGVSELGHVADVARSENAIVEIVTRNEVDRELYLSAGFRLYSVLRRYSCPNLSDIAYPPAEEKDWYRADAMDAEDVYSKLHEVFDSNVSHLGTLDEVAESIQKGNVYICRDEDGSIVSLLEAVQDNTKLYINQVYNDKQKGCIHLIMKNVLSNFVENGGRYLYAWIPENNEPSKRFHAKYKLKPDKLFTFIFK